MSVHPIPTDSSCGKSDGQMLEIWYCFKAWEIHFLYKQTNLIQMALSPDPSAITQVCLWSHKINNSLSHSQSHSAGDARPASTKLVRITTQFYIRLRKTSHSSKLRVKLILYKFLEQGLIGKYKLIPADINWQLYDHKSIHNVPHLIMSPISAQEAQPYQW